MNVLYLIKQPLTPRDFTRFGMDFMLAHGNNVTVLDLSRIMHPELENDQRNAVNDDRITLRILNNWSEFDGEQQVFADTDLVMFLIQGFGLSRGTYRPLRLIAKAGVPYLIIRAPVYPGWKLNYVPQSRLSSALEIFRRIMRADPVNSILSRIRPGYLGLPTAKFVVHVGGGPQRPNNMIGPDSIEIQTHAHDYDNFLQEKSNSCEEKAQAVFIDQYLPFHHDYKEMGASSFDANHYFSCLNALFRQIERDLDLPVIIAAHPRAKYKENDPLFEGRPVIHGTTARLVLESKLVIAHVSLAVGYAIMAKKPLLLVTSKEPFEKVFSEKHYYVGHAEELGIPLNFLDDKTSVNLSKVFEIDLQKYENFLENYLINSNATEKSSWQIIDDVISSRLARLVDYQTSAGLSGTS